MNDAGAERRGGGASLAAGGFAAGGFAAGGFAAGGLAAAAGAGAAAAILTGATTAAAGTLGAAALLRWLRPRTRTPAGSFLNETADRLTEAAVLGALAWVLREDLPATVAATAALGFSAVAWYVPVRAASLRIPARGGFAEGPWRLALLAVAVGVGRAAPALWLLAGVGAAVALRRASGVWGAEARAERAREGRDDWSLRLTGIGWLALWRLLRLVPERTAGGLMRVSSDWSRRRNRRRREVVRANLAAVVPPEALDGAVRDAFRSYGRYWMETFRMQDLPAGELERRFRIEGAEIVDAAHAAGRGGVIATLHLGNWDAGGRWAARRWPVTAVVEVLRPRMLFDRFVRHRESLGMTIIPLARGGDATGRCLERLRAGDLVALVSDRDLSGGGIPVRMFGRATTLPPGPAVLALRAGAPLIPAAIYMAPDGGWDAVVMDPIDVGVDAGSPGAVEELTGRLARAFEQMIRRDPPQWHAFGPYWTDPEPAGAPVSGWGAGTRDRGGR